MTLFTESDLSDFLSKDISVDQAAVAERVVWGWLKPILGWADQPDETPDELFSWALQLGAIACENPSGLSVKEIGPFRDEYSEERRLAILAEVRNSGLGDPAAAAANQPLGDFPDALPYPDPACW